MSEQTEEKKEKRKEKQGDMSCVLFSLNQIWIKRRKINKWNQWNSLLTQTNAFIIIFWRFYLIFCEDECEH